MNTQSQSATLLAHLKTAPITHKEAVQKYFIMGFLARISELRQMGYDIKDYYQTSPTGARYKVYHLQKKETSHA
ncbi:helix-turn-helix domain-containing protein [Moraxella sp. Pampa]|uniref:helix-turn-helix domain-containing protein n=1 Tax=Moraxella sp. Pampa TaxID=3111978 RepID=UPI002B41157F|nr:helix-turn-helix domain-containing protein [Moraxella sp. Pampa]